MQPLRVKQNFSNDIKMGFGVENRVAKILSVKLWKNLLKLDAIRYVF